MGQSAADAVLRLVDCRYPHSISNDLYKNEGKRRGNFRRICFLPILEKRKIIFKRYLSSIFGFLIRMKINAEEILEELKKNLNYEET